MKNILFVISFVFLCLPAKAQSLQVNGYIMGYEYPKESSANSKDTTFISDIFFGKEKIVEFKKATDIGFIFVTEIEGEDGNDHKKAALRHTYILKSNTYSIIKDVKFEGKDKWIKEMNIC